MNSRQAKKIAAQITASALSIPFVLDHAKPSLYALPFGTMRHYVYRTLVRKAFVHPSHAKLAAWRWAHLHQQTGAGTT